MNNPILDVNSVWFETLYHLHKQGQEFAPRGMKTKELLGHQTLVDMSRPVLTVPERKLGYKFMAAEAAWILSGDNRVSSIAPYSKAISSFSDDGMFFNGAYGPKVMDQISYVVETLLNDPDSRQAVINIWREKPLKTKDVPCTISLQFFFRDGLIHCQDTMRSSDVWLGWPYDVFNMSMITLAICIMLRKRTGKDIFRPGILTLTAGSQHVYEPQWEAMAEILAKSNTLSWEGCQKVEPYMQDVDELIAILWHIAEKDKDEAYELLKGGLLS